MSRQPIDQASAPRHAHCPDCEHGKIGLLGVIGTMPETERAVLLSLIDRITPGDLHSHVLTQLVHSLGMLLSTLTERAAIYALHQVVRIEDGTEPGPAVPMACLACVLTDGGVATNMRHANGCPAS